MPTADEDRIAARRAEAIRLRVQGKTIREIAKTLDISVGLAHLDVTAAMAETVKAAAKNADTERAVSLERIDRAIELCMSLVETGDLGAIDRLAKLEDRRAKLLGLDAPQKSELTGKDGGPLEVAEAARERILGRLAGIAATAGASEVPGDPEPGGTDGA